MKTILVLVLFSCPIYSICQPSKDSKRDNIWILGSDDHPNVPGFDGTMIDFSTDPPSLSFVNKPFDHLVTDASICNSHGDLVIYSNGREIANQNHAKMLQSEGFYSGPWHSSGLALCQGTLILPMPGSDSIYIIFHPLMQFAEPFGATPVQLRYSVVDMSKDEGNGAAIMLNEPIINDTIENGQITACRHANGRDWWILVPELVTNRYYRILLDPTGVKLIGDQYIGGKMGTLLTLSQAVFSPDGRQYVRSRGTLYDVPDTMSVYDFDRCTGLLSNPIMIVHAADSLLAGSFLAISPNSHYLYKTLGLYMWQYDLQATDIASSRVLVHTATQQGFFAMQLAPDGKIYGSTSGYSPYLHRIDYPDLPGPACGVCEACVTLPSYNWFPMPNFPNFRLGPVDGSVCDSVGLNVGGVNDELKMRDDEFTAYPNPTQNVVSLSFLGALGAARTAEVFDILGTRIILREMPQFAGEETIDLSRFGNGVYWLVVREKGKVVFESKIAKF